MVCSIYGTARFEEQNYKSVDLKDVLNLSHIKVLLALKESDQLREYLKWLQKIYELRDSFKPFCILNVLKLKVFIKSVLNMGHLENKKCWGYIHIIHSGPFTSVRRSVKYKIIKW